MTKNMLIDAIHPEETRVVVTDHNQIQEFDFESQSKVPLRGNIYLAKITRVEPSLQAAFVEYGGNRHGFLAFNEIHPDYYQIPVGDREELLKEQAEEDRSQAASDDDQIDGDAADSTDDEENASGDVADLGGDAHEEAAPAINTRALHRKYKIQEVIKRRQVILVQVMKEERGNKGAALTTYLSLAGRYCVLMPNTARGGGISRKINNSADRKKLKTIIAKGERFQLSENEFLLPIDQIATFWVKNGNSITIEMESNVSFNQVKPYLYASAMGALAHQRKLFPFHASAIKINGKAYLFCGESGVGKSTLAGYFHKLSYAVLSDDISIVKSDGSNFEEQGSDDQNKLLKIVKDITSKGFVRNNYKKNLVDLSDVKISLKGKK